MDGERHGRAEKVRRQVQSTTTATDGAQRPWIVLSVALGLGLQIATIVIQPFVPLVDLPNHLARHALEADWLAGRALPEFYDVDYRVVPNLGGDLVIPLCMLVFDAHTAAKLFLVLAVVLYWLGPTLYILRTTHQRTAAWCAALALLPWSLSSQFFWGFLNYYSGLGLAFLLLTHGVRLQTRQAPRAWEWLAHALLVALLFLWHLAAWGIYGVLMGSRVAVELYQLWRQGVGAKALCLRALAFVAVCLPSIVLFAIYLLQKSGAGVGETNWGTIVRKLYMPLTLFRGYDMTIDGVVVLIWVAALILLFLRFGRRTSAPFAPSSGVNRNACLLGLVLLSGLYVAIPFQLGGTSDTDSRLLPAMLICVVALLGGLPMQRVRWGLALLAVCLVIRQGSILHAWQQRSARLQTHADAFEHLSPQSRVLPLVLIPQFSKDYPETHFACYAVVTHRAFVPTLFAFRDQQPLQLGKSVPLPFSKTAQGWEFDQAALLRDYDFLWIYNPENVSVAAPNSFQMVFDKQGLRLWRRLP